MGDVVVSSIAELLGAVEEPRTSAPALAGLDVQLQTGFLERWLNDGIGQPTAARSARAIREDNRGLKLERWLQGAGLSTYFIDGRRIDSVHDLASLPERGCDPAKLWEHIREGVPQERFKTDPATVLVLEEVRASNAMPDLARPLIACLRLGLRRLPWADRFLETLADLERAILEPSGRDALHGLLESGVLHTWVDAIAPGQGALVASARGLDPAIAVDRAVRSVLGPAVYPVPRVKAADYAELAECVAAAFYTLCGDPDTRARIRDALLGPIRLPGAPSGSTASDEAELAKLGAPHDANVFAWCVLKLPILHLGPVAVRSVEEYLAAIAHPQPRAAAVQLANAGVVAMWYRLALGGSLPDPLSGCVPEHEFPALCLAMGEPPPQISVAWSGAAAHIPDGGIAVFSVELCNRDPVRTAALELATDIRPARGRASLDPRVVLPPGARSTSQLTYPSPPGISGQTTVAVAISHAGPHSLLIEAKNLLVTAGFPWQAVATTTLGWIALVTAAVFLIRIILEPLAGALLYRANQLELRKPSDETLAFLSLGIAAVGFITEHIVIVARDRRFWPARLPEATASRMKSIAIALAVVAVIVGYQRGLSNGILFGVIAMGVFVVKLSQRDVVGAAIFAMWLFIGRELGWLLLLVIGGLDTVAIMAASVFSSTMDPRYLAMLGWAICGALLGLAFGLAIALRAVSRPFEAEAARIIVLVTAALLIGLLGTG